MTRKLDLRTGRPVWFAYRTPMPKVAPLVRDVRTEVLVIGLGVSGAMIAQSLAEDGMGVVAIDRRGPLRGSTPATTALVQYEIDEPLSVLSGMIGRESAQRAWRRSRIAVTNLAGRIERLGIDCRMSPAASLYLAGNRLAPGELKEEGRERRAAGIEATYLTRSRLREDFGIDRDAALLSQQNLALDPRRLAASLLRCAAQDGARLYAPVEAVRISADAAGVDIETANGPVIRADQVVFATGYELMDPVPAIGHRIVSTFAIATRPQPRNMWPGPAFVWEASDPYLYARATSDGRVICGGEDEDFADEDSRDALIPEKSARIAEKLAKLFPRIDPTPEFTWAGAFGTTRTGLPIIAQVPRKPRLHAIMGYGGNGITYSQIASELVRNRLGGARDADAHLYAFPD